MTLTTVISQLSQQQIKVWAEGEQIRIKAPKGAMTPELRELITANKADLLIWLRAHENGNDPQLPAIVSQPAMRHHPFPLTDIQHAYWLGRSGALTLGKVSTHSYTEFAYSHLDVERLTQALNKVIARHEMLRAIVLPSGQQQILMDTDAYHIPVLDLRNTSAEDQAAQLAAVRQEMSHQVLPLERSPLFDIRVTSLNNAYVLHISIDLLTVDAASFITICEEWRLFYENPATLLPPLALSFRDYVLATEEMKALPRYQAARDYWLKRIVTLPPAPELPVLPISTVTEQTFSRRIYRLKAAPWQAIKTKAQQIGVSPSVLLLTTFSAILKNWCKQPQFTLNLTLFNRLPLHPDVNRLVGDFTTLALVEVDYTTPVSLIEQGQRLQSQLWEVLEHRYFSGIEVMRELNHRRNDPQAGAMPVVFTSTIGVGKESGNHFFNFCDGELRYGITQTPQVWLDHQVWEYQGGISLNWDTVDALFPAGMLDAMFTTYCALIEQLAVDETVWQEPALALLPAPQAAQRAAVNNTTMPISADLLPTGFLRQVQAQPMAQAVITPTQTLTYQELYQRANQLGFWLREQGAKPNQLVAVVMEKGWEQVVAVLGIHLAGAAYLPIDPTLPPERQHYLLQQGEVNLALTQSQLTNQLAWPASIQHLAVDTMTIDPMLPPLALIQQPTDLAYVIYTSGSTGQPKGVVIDHRGAVNTVLDINRRFGVTNQDRVLALSALNFDLSVYDIFGLLAVGGAIVLPEAALRNDPDHWIALMAQHGVTLWDTVPALMQMLVDALENHPIHQETRKHGDKVNGSHQVATFPVTAPQLRLVMLSGDWIPVTLPDRMKACWPTVTVYGLGGATEASIWSNYFLIEEVDPAWPSIPYGKPLTNQSFQVLDANLNPRPVWAPGDLYIGGIGLALGYWKDQEKTDAKFIHHPQTGERLYKTGDLARYLPDGNLEFLGREDFQVKIRGHRIELGEIESALLQHPHVKEGVVTAVGDPKGHRQLVAYVVRAQAPQNGAVHLPDLYTEGQTATPPGFLTDPVSRFEFKLRQPGIRIFDNNRPNSPPFTDQNEIQLTPIDFDTAQQKAWLSRQSYRTFSAEVIPFAAFSNFLSCLTQMSVAEAPLPKYRYPSAGSLYPVQTYLYVKPSRIEGVSGGFYYHQPQHHRLLPLAHANEIAGSLYGRPNQAIFEQAAFALFLVADITAIAPMYGEWARDFVLLEAGYMSQLLMTEASQYLLGLCPVGGGLDTTSVQQALALGDQHLILPNSLLGGRIEPLQHTQWLQPTADLRTSSGDSSSWPMQLQTHLQRKLPAYMVPTIYVDLASLPITANGKVDRKALPMPEITASTESYVAPESELEKTITSLLQEALNIADIGIDHHFADLGLNSVHMVRFNNHLKEALNRPIPITALFQNTTVRTLAHYLAQGEQQTVVLQEEKAVAKTRSEQRAQARLAGRQRQRG